MPDTSLSPAPERGPDRGVALAARQRHDTDKALIAFCNELERAAPWGHRHPETRAGPGKTGHSAKALANSKTPGIG